MRSSLKLNKLIILLLILTLGSQRIQAQWSTGSDIMSRYVWRGMDFGASPSIQPYIEYANSGFTLGAWGAYSMNGSQGQEADLYLTYSFLKERITVSLTDYFFPNELLKNDYFNFRKGETTHLFEGTILFNGTETFPMTFLVATTLYGDDLDAEGKHRFSSYTELGYGFKTKEGITLDLFAGANLTRQSEADQAAEWDAFYGNKAGLINLGLSAQKEIEITSQFSLPLSVSLMSNPMAGNIFFVFGIHL
ncbi:MAG: hypothetical protein M0O94_04065 [Bacteroidales bacterium]|nr:hypothetical protein [Bacteroidales bacterium]HPE87715.1 hypothetical protein [Bacteroidales bacterium]